MSCSAAIRASLDPGGDAELPEDVAQVERDGVRAQEYPVRHLPVAEPLRHQVGDPPLGVGQAVPAEGRAVRVGPVAEPGARGPQPGPDPGQVVGVAELFVQGMGLAERVVARPRSPCPARAFPASSSAGPGARAAV